MPVIEDGTMGAQPYSLELHNRAFGPSYVLLGIVDWPFKYIIDTGTGKEELYDLQEDPGEKNNLITSSEDKAQEMRTLLSSQRSAQLMLYTESLEGDTR